MLRERAPSVSADDLTEAFEYADAVAAQRAANDKYEREYSEAQYWAWRKYFAERALEIC